MNQTGFLLDIYNNYSKASVSDYVKCFLSHEIVFWTSVTICVAGLTLNSIALYILHTKLRRNTANYMLKVLAFVNNLVLVSVFANQLIKYLLYKNTNKDISGYIDQYYLGNSCWNAVYLYSVYIIVLLVTSRCISIANPPLADKVWSMTYVNICLLLLLITTVCIQVPYLYRVFSREGIMRLNWMAWIDTYHFVFLCTVSGPIPVAVIVACLLYMSKHIRKIRTGSVISSTSLEEKKTIISRLSKKNDVLRMHRSLEVTRMFCTIAVVFVISHILLTSEAVVNLSIHPYLGAEESHFHSCFSYYHYSFLFARLGMCLNASSTLIVLAVSGKRFKEKLLNTFSLQPVVSDEQQTQELEDKSMSQISVASQVHGNTRG